MGNNLVKFLFALLIILVVVVISSGIYNAVNEPYKTETAVIYSSADKVSFKGVYIRDESVISQYYTGVLSYPCEDGSKVANGSVVAYVYESESDIETNRKIEALTAEIKLLEAAQNPGTVQTADPAFISDLISERYQSVSTLLAKKNVSEIKPQRDNLLTLMSIYQISVGEEKGYDERIASLAAQAADLRVIRRDPKSVITSNDAGYFVSCTDGYEGKLRMDDTSGIDAALIKDVIENAQTVRENRSKSEIGKLIKGYNWKIAGIINNSDSVYNPGDAVKLAFASTPDTVNAVIEDLKPTDDPEEWILILRCDEMTFDLVQKRTERVEMTLNDFEGIRVPREALRFNKNNEKGCYVLWGQRVLFKKVDTVFEDENYILSRISSDNDYVAVYDDIIIKGVDTAAFMANSDEIVTEAPKDEDEIKYYTTAATEETEEEPVITEPEETGEAVTEVPAEAADDESTPEMTAAAQEGEIHFE